MALYKYFKPSKPSETWATEQNNLSKRENEKVTDELGSVEESKGKRQKYRVWTQTQRAEIPKHSAGHGNASVIRAMGLKYPGLNWQTFSDFNLAYLKLKKVRKLLTVTLQRLKRKNWSPHVTTQKPDKKRNWKHYKFAA